MKEKLIERQKKSKQYYDDKAKDLKPLSENDTVYVPKDLKKPLVKDQVVQKM